jgi:hypothetical protein
LVCCVARQIVLDGDQRDALWLLANRVAFALEDRQLQQRVSVVNLNLKWMLQHPCGGSMIQRPTKLTSTGKSDLADWVKDA